MVFADTVREFGRRALEYDVWHFQRIYFVLFSSKCQCRWLLPAEAEVHDFLPYTLATFIGVVLGRHHNCSTGVLVGGVTIM